MATDAVNRNWGRAERLGLGTGVVALAVFALTGLFGLASFSRAYLVAYCYWLGFTLGAMVLLMVQHLTGGAWGLAIRRILEAATRTLPLMAILFAPVLMNVQHLYPWAEWSEHQLAEDEVLRRKSLYLNVPFFALRALVYFATWLGLMYLLNRWSRAEDETTDRTDLGDLGDPGDLGDDLDDAEPTRRLRRISALGLVLYGATITFASIDWAMSLEPRWHSTIYGALFGSGQVLTGLSFATLILIVQIVSAESATRGEPPAESSPRDSGLPTLERLVSPRTLQDLGSLLLAFVMLWAYMQFSQYLIIWSGNVPEETPWYLKRLQGGWQMVGLVLILLHFALPFLLLMSREIKRHARRLANVALLVLIMRFIDTVWLIVPAGEESHARAGEQIVTTIQAVLAAVGIGGLWVALFTHELRKRPLPPGRLAERSHPHLPEGGGYE